MSFFEDRFPDSISLGATGGPIENTRIISIGSGIESRDSRWSTPRGKWDVSTGLKNDADLETLISFFRVVRGRFRGFRFKDWLDFKSVAKNLTTSDADQNIGTGDGSKTDFQLTKKYTFTFDSRTRTIVKPVNGTVKIAVNGVGKTEGTDFLVHTSLGIISIFTPPPNGQAVTAGFEFDIPARFETDELRVTGITPNVSQWERINVIEIKPAEASTDSVDIDFTLMLTTVLPDSRLSFSRTSQGAYFNSSGILKFALNNEPRPDHDNVAPFTHKGILIERQTSLRISKNRDMTDAAWTATNMTVARDAVGLDGVVNSGNTLTASAANGTVTQSPSLGSVERTYSIWVKRKTGSGVVEVTDDNFSNVLDITASINSTTFTHFELTRTQANPVVGIRVVTSGDVVEVDFNQLEDLSFSTSPMDSDIFTTRQADDLTFNDTSWLNSTEGTVWIECSLPNTIRSGTTLGVLAIYAASTGERITFLKDSVTNKFEYQYDNNTSSATLLDSKVWNADTVRTFIGDYEAADQGLFTDGTSEATATITPVADGLDTVRLGRTDPQVDSGNPRLNGHIQRFKFIPNAGLN